MKVNRSSLTNKVRYTGRVNVLVDKDEPVVCYWSMTKIDQHSEPRWIPAETPCGVELESM